MVSFKPTQSTTKLIYSLSKENYLQTNNGKGFILETAHPVKFPETVEDAIGVSIEFPEQVQHLLSAEKKSILMQADFNNFKEWLMNR